MFWRAVWLLLGGLLLFMGLLLGVLRRQPAPSATLLAFQSLRGGDWDVYTMLSDGSNPRRLTDFDGVDSAPRWSPNGAWLAFESLRDGAKDIFVMRPNGTGLLNLTRGLGVSRAAFWSPDSEWLVFVATVNTSSHIYRVRRDGRDLLPLTSGATMAEGAFWSPDGAGVFFASWQDEQWAIYYTSAEGGTARRISPALPYDARQPRLSWDASQIIFNIFTSVQVWTASMTLDGADMQILDAAAVYPTWLEWSPGGAWVAVVSATAGNREVYTMRPNPPCVPGDTCLGNLLDPLERQNLSRHPNTDMAPSWSPLVSLAWRGWLNVGVGLALLGLGLWRVYLA